MHLYEGWVHPLLYPSRVYAQGFAPRIQASSGWHCLHHPSFMGYAHIHPQDSLMNQSLSQAQGFSLVRLRHLVSYMPRRGALLGLSLVVRSMVLMVCNARASCYTWPVILGFLPIVPGLHWSIVRSWLRPGFAAKRSPLKWGVHK